jgi:spore coat polysaccharide biosynthesis protein SpsF (cytidylyltransferase family)
MPAILTVRLSSSRLPGKALMKIGGMPVLDFVVRRCLSADIEPFVFTSEDPSDDPIAAWCKASNTKFFRGNLLNKVDRWLNGFDHFDLDSAHLVDVDDPFFDPIMVKASLELLQKSGADILLPCLRSDNGEASVGTSISQKALKSASIGAKRLGFNNLDVVPWEQLLQRVAIPRFPESSSEQQPRFRLTLDYQEDYDLLSVLASQFGPDTPRVEIEKFLIHNEDLVNLNVFRNSDFAANKANFRKTHLRAKK